MTRPRFRITSDSSPRVYTMPLNYRPMTTRSQIRDVEKTCVICGSNFFCTRHRTSVAKYCSKKCYNKAMRSVGSVELKCEVCGKIYLRSPSHAHFKTKTCSLKCRGIATRTSSPAYGSQNVSKWLKRRGLMTCCAKCGYSAVPEVLVVHHLDRDHLNNEIKNLQVLCPTCHAVEHLKEQQSGWSHTSSRRRRRHAA